MAKISAAPAPSSEGSSAEVTPIKKKSKLPLMIGALVLLLLGGGGAAWYFMRPPADGAQAAEAKAAAKPIFVTLEPFTVNLAEEGGDHYLQVGIVYQVTDDKVSDSMKLHLPILRDRLLLLLSSKHPSDLATPEGKKQLVEQLVAAARESLPGAAPDKGVTTALLASFVIQ